jgi:trimeric autotransporter adhesin
MKKFQVLITLLCLGLLAGCGGGNNSTSGSKGPGPAVLQSIQVTPSAPSIASGLSQQFTATGRYSDNSSKDLTNSATWSSSNTNTANISNNGAATGKAPG